MAMMSKQGAVHLHREGHVMGDRNKRTSIGEGARKRGSFKRKSQKRYRGQGRRWFACRVLWTRFFYAI